MDKRQKMIMVDKILGGRHVFFSLQVDDIINF